ncbi:MAG: hypothetical protein ACRYFX_19030 [Janthinobacterium lividum]
MKHPELFQRILSGIQQEKGKKNLLKKLEADGVFKPVPAAHPTK